MYSTLRDDYLYGNYRTRTFTDIFPSWDNFLEAYKNQQIDIAFSIHPTSSNLKTLYYLLYARYGNSHIAFSDENQFKYNIWSIIFQYGPTWSKKLLMQKEIRDLSMDDLRESAKAIYNRSLNPSTAPTTNTMDELPTINEQNVTKHKRSRTDAYALLNMLLAEDVTETFLNKFKKLFITVVAPESPLWYVTKIEEE